MSRDPGPSGTDDRIRLVAEPEPLALQYPPKGAPFPESWAMQIIPVADGRDPDPAARPTLVVISSGQYLIHETRVRKTPGDGDGLAKIAAIVLGRAIDSTGATPRRVHVRYAGIAAALAPLVADRGIEVIATRDMPDADFVTRLFIEAYRAAHKPQRVLANASMPEAYACWRLPEDQVRRLFAASAAYIRAAPWKEIPGMTSLLISVRGGGTWSAYVEGQYGDAPELWLQSDLENLELDAYRARHPDDPFGDMQKANLQLTFESADELPAAMLREIRAQEWEVANPSAYPNLAVFDTPGGGIVPRQCEDLIVALQIIPRFAAMHEKRGTERPEPLVDDALGARCEYQDFERVEPLWNPPNTLSPAGPEGRGARPGAQFERRSKKVTAAFKDQLLESFATYLEGKGAAGATLEACVTDVQPFIHFLVEYHEIPPQAVTEFDLRAFLFSWLPERVNVEDARVPAFLGSLHRFFEFLEAEHRVTCMWATDTLDDDETFMRSWHAHPRGEKNPDAYLMHVLGFHADCQARVFFPVGTDTVKWDVKGSVTSRMFSEVQRLWLAWRDEAIRDGVATRKALEDALGQREREWLATPHLALGGETPATAIGREQAAASANRPTV